MYMYLCMSMQTCMHMYIYVDTHMSMSMPMSMSISCSAGPEDAADDKGHDSSNGLSAFAEPSPNNIRASQAGPAWATRHCCRRH